MTVMVPEPLSSGDLDLCDQCWPVAKEAGEWVCDECGEVGCTEYRQDRGRGDVMAHMTGEFLCRNHQYQLQVGNFRLSGLGWPGATHI